jgi:Tol biopolymer transport system component
VITVLQRKVGKMRVSIRHGNTGRRALINAAVVVATVLTGSSIATSAHAAYPGENGRILFGSDRTGSDQIYSMRPDGGDVRRLAHGLFSDWSPDGRWIAFSRRARSGRVEVFVMRRDGRDVRQVTHLGFNIEASWSPNGRLLVFEHAPSSGCCQNIYSIRPDGRGLRKLTHATTARSPAEPEFSPDGRWITFEQFPNTAPPSAIYIMRANGTHVRRVTPLRLDAAHPEWSPDGSLIIFNNHFTLPVGDIFTIRPNGTGLNRLTHVTSQGEADYRPDFSPDGKRIVFTHQTTPDAPADVFVMNADGSNPQLIRRFAFLPDWGPSPED